MADGVALRINVDPSIPSTGLPEYSAKDERLFAGVSMMADGGPLSVREGRRLGSGLEVTVSGDGLSAVVAPGLAVVAHAVDSGGAYRVAVPAQVSKALAAKPGAGLKRRDTVVLDVADEDVTEKPTALREANVKVLAGASTSGTPTAPAAGVMQMELGQVAFDGTNTPTIQPTNPRFTWAIGGIGKVYSQAEEDALTAYDGLKVYRNDLKVFRERVDGGWRDEGADDTGWLTSGVFNFYPALWSNAGTRVRKVGNRVRVEAAAIRESSTIGPGDFVNTNLLNVHAGYRPSVGLQASDYQVAVGNGSGGRVSFGLDTTVGDLSAWSSDNAIVTGDLVRVVLEYYTD